MEILTPVLSGGRTSFELELGLRMKCGNATQLWCRTAFTLLKGDMSCAKHASTMKRPCVTYSVTMENIETYVVGGAWSNKKRKEVQKQ